MPAEWGGRTPRRWQAEALPAIGAALRRGERPVVRACTGSGKSILQAEICGRLLPTLDGEAVIVSAPTQDLVEQLAATLTERCGRGVVGRFYASRKEVRPIMVTCLPSLQRATDALGLAGLRIRLWLADEAHRVQREHHDIVQARHRVGFSATPYRADPEQSLHGWTGEVVSYGLADAQRDGVLVPMVVRSWDGDGETDADAATLDLIRLWATGPGVVSATDVADAEQHAAWLTGQGIPAAPIHGRLRRAERQRLLSALERGELRAVVHPQLLAEGVDLPWLRWIALRRPLSSRVRLVQEVGRVLRTHAGKGYGLVLDPHRLIVSIGLDHEATLADLDAAAEEEVQAPLRAVAEAEQSARRLIADVRGTGQGQAGGWLDMCWQLCHAAGIADHWERHRHDDLDRRARGARWVPESARSAVSALIGAHRPHLTHESAARLAAILSAGQRMAAQRAGGAPGRPDWKAIGRDVRASWPALPEPPGWLL